MSQRKGAMAAAVTASKHREDQEAMMVELRRGPWTLEEDNLLMNYIACHGEGRWNLLARCSGLKRTGKSCRLRWLNYLKPDIKRGNLTPEEQLLILELHSKWGNRWSRIAQHLPGRTDNEIKNYWRTRLLEKMAAHHHGDGELPPPLHPSHNIAGTASSRSPPAHGSQQEDPSSSAPAASGHYLQQVDPSPSTSTTSGSTTSAALPPVPCFSESELRWVVDQYGAAYGYTDDLDLDGGAGVVDDDSAAAAALDSLGLDGLDLGPADGGVYSDATLLDYLNATCAGGTTVMTMMGGVHGAAGGGDGDYGPSPWRTDELGQTARKLGDPQHQWRGGI
uniref:Uncharacterized protein n=1 Tax=Zea mays TaxID=4577 RepID=A0A804QIG3_MAIZE